MIKSTVPTIDDIYSAYLEGFEGIAWCLDLKRLVEVWNDGSWRELGPHEYAQYVSWD